MYTPLISPTLALCFRSPGRNQSAPIHSLNLFFAFALSTAKGTTDSGRIRFREDSCSSTCGEAQKSHLVLISCPPNATVAPHVLQVSVRVSPPKPVSMSALSPAWRSCSTIP